MKSSDIQVGKTYTDGQGNVRRVIEWAPFCGVRYRQVVAVSRPYRTGWEYIASRAEFAAWAKAEQPAAVTGEVE
jgi:hypothetical protein